jgi:hypothetical protein
VLDIPYRVRFEQAQSRKTMTSEGNGTNECSYDGSWTLGHIRNAEFTRDGIPTESDEARYRVKEGGNVLNRYDGPMQMNVTEGSA